MINFSKKFIHINFGISQINSVVNVENQTFFPFLNDSITKNVPNLTKNNSTYALVYPQDLSSFLEKQKNELSLSKNSEVQITLLISKYLISSGRSNVGKSSLMNSILNNDLAKISKTPGKTNYLQFINLPQFDISLVDCPGYGFAKRTQKEKKEWNKMMEYYLTHKNYLRRLLILVDGSVGVTDLDENCMKTAAYLHIEYNIVLTKIDKLDKKDEINLTIEKCKAIMTKYTHYSPFIFMTSSKTNFGINELKAYILFLQVLHRQSQVGPK